MPKLRHTQRLAGTPSNDERHCRSGLLSGRTSSLPDRAGTFPERQEHSRARPGMETDAEVEVIDCDSGHKTDGKLLIEGFKSCRYDAKTL
jgi:hypothetical protein